MAQTSLVAVGTYTRTTSDGIYVCEFNGETGELEPVSSIAGRRTRLFSRCIRMGGRCTRPRRSRTSTVSDRGRCTLTTLTGTLAGCPK